MTSIWRGVAVACLATAIHACWIGCGTHTAGTPRSRLSFDQIQSRVAGKTEAEVESILGKPDTREARLVDDDVWIWWDFTFLDGEQYAPEVRGQVVHLEITFDKPPRLTAAQRPPHCRCEWLTAAESTGTRTGRSGRPPAGRGRRGRGPERPGRPAPGPAARRSPPSGP